MKYITIEKILHESEREKVIRENFCNNKLDITIEYPSLFKNAKVLREFILDISEFFNFKKYWEARMTLIADELNNNAIEYWSQELEINKMRVKLIKNKKTITLILEVEDTGEWISAKRSEEMKQLKKKNKNARLENHKWIRWRGLIIIDKLVEKLYFKDSEWGWLIVGIEKEVPCEKLD